MVSIDKVATGAYNYFYGEFVSKFTDIRKWLLDGTAMLMVDEINKIYGAYADHPMVKLLGLTGENNTVDVDKAYRYLRRSAERGAVGLKLPIIGAATLDVSDVDKLYQSILNA